MKEEIIEKLTDNFDVVCKWIEAGGNFVTEQTPLLIQEATSYYMVMMGVGLTFIIVGGVFLGIFRLAVKCANYEQEKDEKKRARLKSMYRNGFEDCFGPIGLIGMVISGGVGICIFAVNVISLLKVTIAPRLWIIETLLDKLS